MKTFNLIVMALLGSCCVQAQDIIPFDTANWDIQAQGYVLENIDGEDAIYLKNGVMIVKDANFLNGTIEYDIRMTDRRGFYAIQFRAIGENNAEEFYFRPHQSGKADANQATPIVNGRAGWQLYFGQTYSFNYDYPFERWMHVKVVVKDRQAQVYLDGTEKPNLSWKLKHEPKAGALVLTSFLAPMHYANFSFQRDVGDIIDFDVKEKPMAENVIEEWTVSDAFEEAQLERVDALESLISARQWNSKVQVEENSACNLSWAASGAGDGKNTVFASLTINSSKDQLKQFDFGYSDRVVVILNGQPIYKGTNKFRTRDYRYLGTIGLFDGVYLPLKKGENTLLLAVSEDFGGWGVTGKFPDMNGVKIK